MPEVLQRQNGRKQLVPLSQRAADAISAQQKHLRTVWPSGCSRLFPSTFANPDGDRPSSNTAPSDTG